MARLGLSFLMVIVAGCGGGGEGAQPDAAPGVDAGPSCAPPQATAQLGTDFFTDVTREARLDDTLLEPRPAVGIHPRLGFADLDGDGCDDVVMHAMTQGGVFEHLLFRNDCSGHYSDVSEASGLRDVPAAFFVFADVDNDGDQDCFAGLDNPVEGLHHSLWLNDGQGHFTVKPASGLEGATGNSVAGNAVFGDFDGDARLDLYLANGWSGYLAADQLFLGHGDGTFSDASSRLRGNRAAPSNGSVACDVDADGDLDIVVSVYGVSQAGAQDFLWENDGQGNFSDVAAARGVASQSTGNTWLAATGYGTQEEPGAGPGHYVGGNGFGIACGDVDNDGDLDLYEGNISHPVASDYSRKWSDPSLLLLNQGGTFENASLAAGLPFNEGDIDVAMADFDNDGLLDLSVTRDKKYEGGYDTAEQKGVFGLMHQGSDHTFASVSMTAGISTTPGFMSSPGSGSHAWADVDHDGDLDLLLAEGGDPALGHANQLFRNDLDTGHHWLEVRLVGDGVHVPRDPLGSRVTVAYDGPRLTRELQSSRGTWAAADSRTLHFGLGTLACDGELVVRWSDGTVQTFPLAEVGTDKIVTIDYARGLQ